MLLVFLWFLTGTESFADSWICSLCCFYCCAYCHPWYEWGEHLFFSYLFNQTIFLSHIYTYLQPMAQVLAYSPFFYSLNSNNVFSLLSAGLVIFMMIWPSLSSLRMFCICLRLIACCMYQFLHVVSMWLFSLAFSVTAPELVQKTACQYTICRLACVSM